MLEEVVEVLNAINGRRLWVIGDDILKAYALAKAPSLPSINNPTKVNGDVKTEFREGETIEELEKSIVQAEAAIVKGKELLITMRRQKVEEALSALARATDKDVEEIIKQLHN